MTTMKATFKTIDIPRLKRGRSHFVVILPNVCAKIDTDHECREQTLTQYFNIKSKH